MHKSLDEFEFQPDLATDFRVTCPLASKKLMYNVVNILAPPYLIGFSSFLQSSFLQVTRTMIKSRILPDPIMNCGVSCP